ncbi:ScbA/BarX family gamma-butyrolactone biosynthesis protein [Streptomyces sp. NPDC016309]|uniref:ScbA/BarX family gamma-butyrolactone biosynthesis protein n=1 Tax=Streptomyces sp. NPDC016309 TaxID=3364965 RepID=UPI0036F8C7F0
MTTSTFRTEHSPSAPPLAEDRGAGPAHCPPAFRFPSLTTTVPKEFVHRAAVAEVMLTDWRRLDDTHFHVTGQWPRGHSFFSAIDGHHDPLLAAETIRQIGSLLAHAEFGVPFGHHFLMWDLEYTVVPEHVLVGDAPAALDIDVVCTEVKRRGDNLTGLRYTAVIRRGGQVAVTGSASYTCTSPAVYRRLRAGRGAADGRPPIPLTAPASPQSVGRTSPMDVVLSPIGEESRWQLRADSRHHVLFDHPVDHVPGMVLLEAARQAAAAALGDGGTFPLAMTGRFTRYAELDTPCMVGAEVLPEPTAAGHRLVRVTGHQEGEDVFSATVTAASRPL